MANPISIRIPEELIEELKQEAEADGRGFSNYVVYLLKNRSKQADFNGTPWSKASKK